MIEILKIIIMPPAINIILILISIIFLRKKWILNTIVLSFAIGSLYLFSTPFGSKLLLDPLQQIPPVLTEANAKAIVILSAGVYTSPQGIEMSSSGFKRIIYGAQLHQLTNLPIIIIGGGHNKNKESLAMKRYLEENFAITDIITEQDSTNTLESAQNIAPVLQEKNIHRFYLVTDAWHQPRATWIFEQLGFNPIGAPSSYANTSAKASAMRSWLPNAYKLQLSAIALHENIGLLWYKFKRRRF